MSSKAAKPISQQRNLSAMLQTGTSSSFPQQCAPPLTLQTLQHAHLPCCRLGAHRDPFRCFPSSLSTGTNFLLSHTSHSPCRHFNVLSCLAADWELTETPSGFSLLPFELNPTFPLSHTPATPAGGELLTSCLHDEYHRGGSSGSATVHCKVPPPPAGAAPPSFAPQGQPVLGATKPEAPAKPAHLGPR